MPDIKIPHLTLPTGNSSETDVGSSTARSSGRQLADSTSTAVGAAGRLQQSQNNRKPRRNSLRKEKKATSTPKAQGLGSESDATSSARSQAAQQKPPQQANGSYRRARRVGGRGNRPKQLANADASPTIDVKKPTATLISDSTALPTQSSHYPAKKIRRSFGSGNCAKKPQPLKLTLHNSSGNPPVTKAESTIPTERGESTTADNEPSLPIISAVNLYEQFCQPSANITGSNDSSAVDLKETLPATIADPGTLEIALEAISLDKNLSESIVPNLIIAEGGEESVEEELKSTTVAKQPLPLAVLQHDVEELTSTPTTPRKTKDSATFDKTTPALSKAVKALRSTPTTPLKSSATKVLKKIVSAPSTPTKVSKNLTTALDQHKTAPLDAQLGFKAPEQISKTQLSKTSKPLKSTQGTPSKSTEAAQALKRIASAPSTPTKIKNFKAPLTPQRKNTNTFSGQYYRETILQFRSGKSVSQMDLKQARRSSNYQLIKATVCSNEAVAVNGETAVDTQGMGDHRKSIERQLYYVIHEQNPRYAGMRVLTAIMLNAWRKRRIEVKQLSQQVEELKHQSVKAKNQLHVFNSLFRVEKKRNEQLTVQLNHKQGELFQLNGNCDLLTTTTINLRTDLSRLRAQLDKKDRDYEELDSVLTEVKSELFKAMSLQREMQTQLSNEQRRVQELENENADLNNELLEQKRITEMHEQEMELIIEEHAAELNVANRRIEFYKEEIEKYKLQELKLYEAVESESKLKQQIATMENDLRVLRKYVNATMAERCKNFWNSTKDVPRGTFIWLHWLAFYMLPATPVPAQPLPSLPFGLTLEKALSIVKR